MKICVRRVLLHALLALALSAALLSGCPNSQNNEEIVITITDESGGDGYKPATREEIVQAARSEAEINWYTSMPEQQASEFAAGFEKQYDFLRVRITRQSTFDIVARVEDELNTGRTQADVIHVLDPGIFIALRKRGQLYRYESPESKNIPPQYKDPGYWTAARLVTVCLAYNTDRVSANDAPRTWRDLLDEKWAHRIAMKDAETGGSAYAQYYFLREKYGAAYWEELARLRPAMYKSEDRVLQAVLNGTADVAGGVLGYKIYQYEKVDKQPVRAVWPTDGVPVSPGPVAMLRTCPHPNASKLFVDYVLSREGQAALASMLGSYSPRPDVDAPEGRIPLSELVLLRAEDGWEEYQSKQGALRSEYGKLFNPESE